MNIDEALRVVDTPEACVDEVHRTLAAEVRSLHEVKRQVREVRDAMERGVYGSAEEAADVLSRALRGGW